MKIYIKFPSDEFPKTLAEKATEYGYYTQNQLIERALRVYIEHLEKAAYLNSFKKMKGDEDVIRSCRRGMADYYPKAGK